MAVAGVSPCSGASCYLAISPNLEVGWKLYAEVRADAQATGRDPDSLRSAPAIYVTVGETQAIARG
ncbi:MAG: hypothetical protein GKR94_34455 [Gammaproteobacteria bacterium]|nr:hypothetical protein [Gammaproteobacteria bacterium]